MKKLLFLLLVVASYSVNAQGVGIGTLSPDSSAMLELSSTSKGFLIPRMNHNQFNVLPNPATGLMIYLTDIIPGIWFNRGTPAVKSWVQLAAGPAIGDPVGVADFQTLSNKNLVDYSTRFQNGSDATKKMYFDISSYSTGTTRQVAFPNADLTVVGTNVTQTL